MRSFILVPVLAIVLGACSSSHQRGTEVAGDTAVTPAARRADTGRRGGIDWSSIGSRSCMIVGTITAIDPMPRSNNPGHPTAKYPSVATVRVDSVLMTGPNFPQHLAPGQSITITFAHTLSPTKDIIKHLSRDYPGLSVNQRFQGEVIDRAIPAGKASQDFSTTPLVIFDYQAL
jgi:hypothetical protein